MNVGDAVLAQRLRVSAATGWGGRLRWADTFTRELPGDSAVAESPFAVADRQAADGAEEVVVATTEAAFRLSRAVRGALWSWAVPVSHPEPQLVGVSDAGARLVGLSRAAFWDDPRAAAAVWSGNVRLAGSRPWAHCYGGHQFGVWADQLGDGRAISLGEVVGDCGRWEVQLKGAGRTPYSRFADGYAVRRSSIREYLAAEHMAALGVPTSRSLALVFTGRVVQREEEELGAIVARLAPSWVRFGSFELPASRREHAVVQALADYTIRHHFPDAAAGEARTSPGGPNRYAELLRRVVQRTAVTVARWQAAGFCHGVMNTDNMSVLGLTIDYGPFAFLDAYDPGFICNHSDPAGRYAFDEQPRVALWNLLRLATPLAPLIERGPDADWSSAWAGDPQQATVATIQGILNGYGAAYRTEYAQVMRRKFGLLNLALATDVDAVVQPFLDLLADAKADYVYALRTLCDVPQALAADASASRSDALGRLAALMSGRALNTACDPEAWTRRMRDYLHGIYAPRLLEDAGGALAADAAAAVGARMRRENPRFVLRNWVAQDIIERADKGDVAWVDCALAVLTTHAFSDQLPAELAAAEKYAGPVPSWGEGLQCSCSS
ncbi:hypothetical protein IWQ57_001961 [Coemansia nantahalensis]|uniref:Uncharacterized protein n=1 Tax=Coemansia nantahalensis TaxID=2789366 RepID=A0ACC1K2A7_9FUNG|nr:hypothetical protein IWQ57_001961 [Coemansia nantahalensis]